MANLNRIFLLSFNPSTHQQTWSCHFDKKETDIESSIYQSHGFVEIARFDGVLTEEQDHLLEFGVSEKEEDL